MSSLTKGWASHLLCVILLLAAVHVLSSCKRDVDDTNDRVLAAAFKYADSVDDKPISSVECVLPLGQTTGLDAYYICTVFYDDADPLRLRCEAGAGRRFVCWESRS